MSNVHIIKYYHCVNNECTSKWCTFIIVYTLIVYINKCVQFTLFYTILVSINKNGEMCTFINIIVKIMNVHPEGVHAELCTPLVCTLINVYSLHYCTHF